MSLDGGETGAGTIAVILWRLKTLEDQSKDHTQKLEHVATLEEMANLKTDLTREINGVSNKVDKLMPWFIAMMIASLAPMLGSLLVLYQISQTLKHP